MRKLKKNAVFEEIKQQRLDDERELEESQESELLLSLVELIFYALTGILGVYLVLSEKMRWFILVLLVFVITAVHFVIKHYKKNAKTQPEISPKR